MANSIEDVLEIRIKETNHRPFKVLKRKPERNVAEGVLRRAAFQCV
jgi:hypothetical protein